jgi:hypothetical protein
LKRFAQGNNLKPEDLMDDLKDWTKVAEHNLHGGLFTQKEQLG